MNVCLAAFAKHPADVEPLRRLFDAARSHLQSVYPDVKETARRLVRDRFALYNTAQLSGAWSAPVWVQTPRVVVSLSAPPVPRDRRVIAAAYETHLLEATAADEGLAGFNPGYFGIRFDVAAQRLRVWSDLIGFGRCYYVDNERFFAVSNSLAALAFFHDGELAIDETAWSSFAGFGWFVGARTPFVGVSRLPPATLVTCSEDGVHWTRYGDYDGLARPRECAPDYEGVADELSTIVCNAAGMMVGPPTFDLSGGSDSRLATAAWIASGAPVFVRTKGTLSQEAVVAERLMSLARAVIDLEAQGVHHSVTVDTREDARQSLVERIDGCMRVWDGDYAPIRLMRDVSPGATRSVHVGGGGGEIAHATYYRAARQFALVQQRERPIDRLVDHFTGTGAGAVPPAGRRLIADQIYAVEADAHALGLAGPTILDYFYFRERFRRWVPAGHSPGDLTLFASPAFIRLAFDVSPRDRFDRLIHRRLTETFMPAWAGVPYYKAAPSDDDERAERGLRLWQGDTRDLIFDTVAEGIAYRQFWEREALLDLSLRVARGRTQNRNESVFQKILWFEGFAKHARLLSSRVRAARLRAFAAGELAD